MQQQNVASASVEFVDDRDLAERTPLSRSHWQGMRQRGEGPAWRKVGRRCVYKWSDVVAWLESQPAGQSPVRDPRA